MTVLAGMAACAALAACGGGTTVSSAGFVSTCQTKLHLSASLCQCVQQKLEADGDGNQDYTANSASSKVQSDATSAGEQCAAGSGSSPSTSPSTAPSTTSGTTPSTSSTPATTST